MGTILLIAMFITTMAALNFTSNEKPKMASLCNVITLCLIVATAYQFALVQSILIYVIVIVAGFIGFKVFEKKRQNKGE